MKVMLYYQNYKIQVADEKIDIDDGLRLKICIFEEDKELKSLFIEEKMPSIITADLVLIDEDKLLVGCSNILYCFHLPSLDLLWKTQTDEVVNFKIYKINGGYLTHGELNITKISPNGEKLWEFSGADIWVSVDEGEEVVIFEKDYILLRDFTGDKYKIDYNGNPIGGIIRHKNKPWWKFW